jgi:hypothetical protein
VIPLVCVRDCSGILLNVKVVITGFGFTIPVKSRTGDVWVGNRFDEIKEITGRRNDFLIYCLSQSDIQPGTKDTNGKHDPKGNALIT